MGHHNKKAAQSMPTPVSNPPFDINSMGQLLNNVDINTMSNMLSKMDINQIISILSKAVAPSTNAPPDSTSGNINSSNPNAPPANVSNSTSGNISSSDNSKSEYFNPLKAFNIPGFNLANNPVQTPLSPILPPNDPAVIILNSLKPFLPSDKCIIVDNMIQIYGIKTVIDKIFPPSPHVNSSNKKNNSDDIKSEEQSTNKPETTA